MTNRLELNWKLDGFVSEQRYYCSETAIDVNNLPAPKAILAGDVRTYTDVDIDVGKTYYIRVSAVKNAIEKVSDQIIKLVGTAWTPSNLVSAKIYLDADDLAVGGVENWIDKKNGYGFSQATQTKRPVATQKEGFKVVSFNGTSHNLENRTGAVGNLINGVASHWIFAIAKKPTSTAGKTSTIMHWSMQSNLAGGRHVFTAGWSTSGNDDKFVSATRRLDSDARSDIVTSSSSISSGLKILVSEVNFSSRRASIWVDSIETQITPTWSAGNTTTMSGAVYVGGEPSASTSYFSGEIACIVVGNTPLTHAERQKLEGWAAHKYGLTGNLPIDHPYKILVPVL